MLTQQNVSFLGLLFSFLSVFIIKCSANPYCITPFGSTGVKMNILNCEPIKWLFSHYGTSLPRSERIFLKRSILTDINSNFTTVCCDNSMNVSIVFKSIGREILKNEAQVCGDNTVKRISFADERTFMSYPWSALLIYDTPQRFQCGGTLITNRYVLTAAQCVTQNYFTLIAVRLREHNTTSEKDCALDDGGFEHCYQPVLDLSIEKIIMHPSYSSATYKHDIALLRLERFVKYERSIRSICLPEYQNQNFDTDYGVITGWGATAKGKYSNVLLEATVSLDPFDNYQNDSTKTLSDDFKIFAVGENSKAPCIADSGGPLILRIEGYMNERKFRYLQAGIISKGSENCNERGNNLTIQFTKVSAYMDWIAASIEL